MSRCASGSSSRSTSGRRARQAASATSLRCPPLSSRVGRSPSMPRSRRWPRASPSVWPPPSSSQRASSRSWRARARVIASRSCASAGSASRASAACSSASSSATSGRAASTVASGVRSSPATCCGRKACTRPRRRTTSPASGCSRPARMRSSVDLPPPLGPSTPIREPAASSRSSPSRTRRPPKVFASPRAERSGTLAMTQSASGGAGSAARRVAPTTMAEPPRIHLPASDRPDLERAVADGGGELAPLERADGLVWLGGRPRRAARAAGLAALGPAAVGRRRAVAALRPRRRLPRVDVRHRRVRAAGRRARARADAGRGQGAALVRPRTVLGRRGPPPRAGARGSDGRDRRRGRHRPRADPPARAVRRRGDRGHPAGPRRARRGAERCPPTASARSGARPATS